MQLNEPLIINVTILKRDNKKNIDHNVAKQIMAIERPKTINVSISLEMVQ